ncbi:MAG: molybdopterin-binding protein [Thermosphaera sp.]
MLKKIEESVGLKAAHDYSAVTPEYKGAVVKKGEVISPEHVELMKQHGHYYVYVEAGDGDWLWEDKAVVEFGKAVVDENIEVVPRSEGKAFLLAKSKGLVRINRAGLLKVNTTGLFLLITLRTGSFVREKGLIGIVDMVPLKISQESFNKLLENLRSDTPIISINPATPKKAAIIVTGNEIVDGLKKDLAGPLIEEKLKSFDCQVVFYAQSRDDEEEIARKILEGVEAADVVIVSGGMSVDPTDKTPVAISRVADRIVFYGIPIKPTTMSMLAYKKDKAILGVSSGIIHFPDYNVLDVILPWVASNTEPSREYIAELGEGGLSNYFLRKMKL